MWTSMEALDVLLIIPSRPFEAGLPAGSYALRRDAPVEQVSQKKRPVDRFLYIPQSATDGVA